MSSLCLSLHIFMDTPFGFFITLSVNDYCLSHILLTRRFTRAMPMSESMVLNISQTMYLPRYDHKMIIPKTLASWTTVSACTCCRTSTTGKRARHVRGVETGTSGALPCQSLKARFYSRERSPRISLISFATQYLLCSCAGWGVMFTALYMDHDVDVQWGKPDSLLHERPPIPSKSTSLSHRCPWLLQPGSE